MKFLLFIPLLAVAMLTSCRVVPPIDPMTMEPSARCTPGGFTGQVTDSCK